MIQKSRSPKSIKEEFETEYRKVQQMGNTSISLLKNFENDKPFMDVFQNEFAAAPIFADVSKYFELHYSDEDFEKCYSEGNPKMESHLIDLLNEFSQLITDNNVPLSCYTHNIKETNIYRQLKEIEIVINDLKKMEGFEQNAKEYAQVKAESVLREIAKIKYGEIQKPLIELIISDKGNIRIYLDNLSGENDTKAMQRKGLYATLKDYFNSYLANYLKTLPPQQTETKTEQEKFIINEYALAYIFDLFANNKQIPINQTDGGYNKKGLIKAGFQLYQLDKDKDTFYRAVKHVASFDLNKLQDLMNISKRWVEAVKTLSKDWIKTEQYLKEKTLIGG